MKRLRTWFLLGLGLLCLGLLLDRTGFYRSLTRARGLVYRSTHSQGARPTVAELQAQVQALEGENERLRGLLKLPRRGWKLSLTAHCLYRNGTSPESDLWLDRGQVDGVSLRTVALHSAGLVGRVVEVEPDRCRLRPVLASQTRVPVLVGDTGLQGIARGKGWTLEVTQVRARPEAVVGSWVTTSGLGQVYPGSVLVGQVLRSLPSSEPMFARYEVEPAVLVDQVLEVLLVEMVEDRS